MICPKCKKTSDCPCKACDNWKKPGKRWIWDSDGTRISCGWCFYTLSADQWEDLEWEGIVQLNMLRK